MALPLLYLGYLGIAAVAGLLTTSCDSEDKKNKNEPMISAEPSPPPPLLKVEKNVPAYGVYLQLLEAGLNPYQMDSIRDGQITEEELYHAGRTFFRTNLSTEENTKWRDKIDSSFQTASDRYFSMGAEKSGLIFPEACQSVDLFKKAVFWNSNNGRAQMFLGVCQSDPKRLLTAIRLNPEFEEAKQALEKIYREAAEKNPKDGQAWKNLGDALKMQNKITEARTTYQKALHLDPNLDAARLELNKLDLKSSR